jgi:hypothetical protein
MNRSRTRRDFDLVPISKPTVNTLLVLDKAADGSDLH